MGLEMGKAWIRIRGDSSGLQGDMGQARGVVMLICKRRGLDFFEYTPRQVKQVVVGYGMAEKSQVQFMVKNIFNLKSIPKPDDAADALALCYAMTQMRK